MAVKFFNSITSSPNTQIPKKYSNLILSLFQLIFQIHLYIATFSLLVSASNESLKISLREFKNLNQPNKLFARIFIFL